MRPFPGINLSHQQRIFNYRLSRARRVVENMFGIMVSRFLGLRQPLLLDPGNAEKVIETIAVLHNFLRLEFGVRYLGETTSNANVDATQDSQLISFRRSGGRSVTKAVQTRNFFATCFASPSGSIPWQEEYINATS